MLEEWVSERLSSMTRQRLCAGLANRTAPVLVGTMCSGTDLVVKGMDAMFETFNKMLDLPSHVEMRQVFACENKASSR